MACFRRRQSTTSLYVPQRMPDAMRGWDIRTSWLNRIPGRDRLVRYLLPLYPGAFRGMNLVDHDLVISIKSAFCLGVRTAADGNRARHVCYCLTPTRFLWNFDQYMVREQVSGPARTVTRIMLERLRRWELEAAKGVDDFIAISTAVQERIRDVYSRDSTVIHPPVATEAFRPRMAAPREGFYLVVSRLIPYKRIDLAVSAFNRMPDRNLVIVGDGRDAAALKAMAGSNIRFTDYLPRHEVVDLMQRCRGLHLSRRGGLRHHPGGSHERRQSRGGPAGRRRPGYGGGPANRNLLRPFRAGSSP